MCRLAKLPRMLQDTIPAWYLWASKDKFLIVGRKEFPNHVDQVETGKINVATEPTTYFSFDLNCNHTPLQYNL